MPTLVSTGQYTVVDTLDGVNARLSSESHVLPANNAGVVSTYAGCSTTMSVFLGAMDDTSNWTFSAMPTAGVIGNLVGNTYTVTSLSGDAGFVDIAASRPGFASVVSRFSVTKAKTGAQGPAVSIVASGQGFTFQDGVAFPASQRITLTLIRGNNTNEHAVFVASNGAQLKTDNGQLSLFNYMMGTPGTGRGDTVYFDLADFGGERQVTITAFCGDVSTSFTIVRLDFSTAEPGATNGATIGENVYGQITPENASTLIASGAIGNAYIGNFIASNNFDGTVDANGVVGDIGTEGWIVGKGGKAVFQDAVVRGDVQATSLNAATGTFSGTLTSDAVNAVNTINIAGNAVTTHASASGNGSCSTTITIPPGTSGSVVAIVVKDYATHSSSTNDSKTLSLSIAGNVRTSRVRKDFYTGNQSIFYYYYPELTVAHAVQGLSAGTHTISVTQSADSDPVTLAVFASWR